MLPPRRHHLQSCSHVGKRTVAGGGFFCAFDDRGYLPSRLVGCDRQYDSFFAVAGEDDYAAAKALGFYSQGPLGYDPANRRPVNMTAMCGSDTRTFKC